MMDTCIRKVHEFLSRISVDNGVANVVTEVARNFRLLPLDKMPFANVEDLRNFNNDIIRNLNMQKEFVSILLLQHCDYNTTQTPVKLICANVF